MVGASAPWSSSPPSDLRITRVSRCVARGHKARASFMSAGYCWWRSLAVDGCSGTSRGHAPELRSSHERPQRCCAAWRVAPSRAAISAHEYPMLRSPVTAWVIASSSSVASPVMSARASTSPAATRRAWPRMARRTNAAYSVVLDGPPPPVWCQAVLDAGLTGMLDCTRWVVCPHGGGSRGAPGAPAGGEGVQLPAGQK